MSNISVVLIEDHDLSRIGLCAALKQYQDVEVIDNAANGNDGLQKVKTHQPDIALIDIGLPDIDGIEVTQKLKQYQADNPDFKTKVLMLTMHDSEDAVMAAFAAGADSYSLKDVSMDNLVQAIRNTHEGNAWIDPAIARIVLKQAQSTKVTSTSTSTSSPQASEDNDTQAITAVAEEYQQLIETYPLTDRELEVLELIVAGCSNAEISEKLYITVGTVKTHVCHILNKLCADDRTQAAVRALRAGLVK
ncbi:Response regulator containing a CheY-like receiver domain and an HTH DNA-binding domain [Hyella patelloides LEGE 07179]|uniref:Response regulator containing a CheY-like receiver domain and an HTH DNA-binding domain n=1 Tax=Hyella patelloides LEGE 07179 TaxID=945734 RepID=A0A563VR67_9CYAN|nr:response regulator transcription factor [Hyella patelloides]VEP13889.1 Response regulator containing a CheY-like receiver domain and an HTH DNA-binding domain [Hyella patelloides LEGE 07179]